MRKLFTLIAILIPSFALCSEQENWRASISQYGCSLYLEPLIDEQSAISCDYGCKSLSNISFLVPEPQAPVLNFTDSAPYELMHSFFIASDSNNKQLSITKVSINIGNSEFLLSQLETSIPSYYNGYLPTESAKKLLETLSKGREASYKIEYSNNKVVDYNIGGEFFRVARKMFDTCLDALNIDDV